MNVISQSRPAPAGIPGVDHATWAGADDGLTQVSIWRQTLAPGAATPPHRHDCDEVVMCHAGRGELHVDGALPSSRAAGAKPPRLAVSEKARSCCRPCIADSLKTIRRQC